MYIISVQILVFKDKKWYGLNYVLRKFIWNNQPPYLSDIQSSIICLAGQFCVKQQVWLTWFYSMNLIVGSGRSGSSYLGESLFIAMAHTQEEGKSTDSSTLQVPGCILITNILTSHWLKQVTWLSIVTGQKAVCP